MVEFTDGATLAQTSPPDMRLPIALGIDWPDRVPDAAPGVDWTTAHTWELFPLDDDAFPAVAIAKDAGRAGGVQPALFNAANEEAVAAFREGRLPSLGIVDTVARVVEEHGSGTPGDLTLDDVLAADGWARTRSRELTGTD
jgi:1-deoxy-D-xylulose-5-phosphate reductoisomerase